jgi:hypothetical protein
MIQHIQSAVFDHMHPRKFHHLSNLCLILAVITLSLTLFAHGLGIVGTIQPHGQTISEKFCTVRTKVNLLFLDLMDVEKFERKSSPLAIVILSAKYPNKFYQYPNIQFLLLRNLFMFNHLPFPNDAPLFHYSTIPLFLQFNYPTFPKKILD